MTQLKHLADGRKKKTKSEGRPPRLLREVAYERLKDAIQQGELQPGEPLSETRLSEALEISRTPVREALQKLAQEGMVQIMANRAVIVAAPSFQEVLNVLHIRMLVEPEMIRIVTEPISQEALDLLWDVIGRMEQAAEAGDRAEWSKADNIFHDTLGDACPNELLAKLALQMRNRMHFMATDSQTSTTRLIGCTKEHRDVIEAIARRDPDAAADAMRHHIQQVRTSFFRRLGYM